MLFSIQSALFQQTRFRVLMHAVFWIGFLVLRFYLTLIGFNIYNGFDTTIILLLSFCSTICTAVAFYFLLAVWTWRRSWVQVLLAIPVIFLLYTIIDSVAESTIIGNCDSCLQLLRNRQPEYYALLRSSITNIALKRFLSLGSPLGLLLALAIPLTAKMTRSAYRKSLHSIALEKENLQLQHNYLKAQLNPHFLFNCMNNIYGLINSGQNERSADLVAKLSQLLRYLLYGSGAEKVALAEETEFISDYIALEKIRLNEARVTFDYEPANQEFRIAPLILIPLVENAFKFVSDNNTSVIDIKLQTSNGKLFFEVANSIDSQKQGGKEGGIGLVNLKKRLELYYPGRYIYQSKMDNNCYCAQLTIQLT